MENNLYTECLREVLILWIRLGSSIDNDGTQLNFCLYVYMKHTSIMLHYKCTSTKRTGNNCKFNFFLTENKKQIFKMIFHTKKQNRKNPKN